MSVKATLSADGLEEAYSVPTLKDLCLYRCLTNKEILTKEVVYTEGKDSTGSWQQKWEKYRLNGPLQPELVDALLDAGSEFLFRLTPQYETVLAAIRMSQPQHLVMLNLSNSDQLQDCQLEWLLSGGNVKWLDIHGCISLRRGTLEAINKYGSRLEYLRIGDSYDIFPSSTTTVNGIYPTTLKVPKLKTLILNEVCSEHMNVNINWNLLLNDIMKNIEELQVRSSLTFKDLNFLQTAKGKMTKLTLSNCNIRRRSNVWEPLFKLEKLKYLDLTGTRIGKSGIGKHFVHRILSKMTNLTELYVDSRLIKNVDISGVTQQGSAAKRLEILGVMDKADLNDFGIASNLANKVICFGTLEDNLQVFEYFSNRFNLKYYDPMIVNLISKINSNGSAWELRSALALLIKMLKNSGVFVMDVDVLCYVMSKALTPVSKIDEVLMEQFIEVICLTLEALPILMSARDRVPILFILTGILIDLETKLSFKHYITALPMILHYAKDAASKQAFRDEFINEFVAFLRRTVRLLNMAILRFQGQNDTAESWGISSVIAIIREFPAILQVSMTEATRENFVTLVCSMIENLKTLCLNSVQQSQSFCSSEGIETALELLMHFIKGTLKTSDRAIVPLLDILGSILQDATMEKVDFDKITHSLETSMFGYFKKYENFYFPIGAKNDECKNVLKTVIDLLESAETVSRFEYKLSKAVIECVKEFNKMF